MRGRVGNEEEEEEEGEEYGTSETGDGVSCTVETGGRGTLVTGKLDNNLAAVAAPLGMLSRSGSSILAFLEKLTRNNF